MFLNDLHYIRQGAEDTGYETKIVSSDGVDYDNLGISKDISDDYLIAGAFSKILRK